ncbi:MAG: dephospho-CoA kinase [Mariprofundales bacterium]|nr:dephospho-CoA kinase [Mariprofundales bacterium]
MISVALTGKIGSGKSRVAAAFHDLSVPVLDLDVVGHKLQQQPEVITIIKQALGEEVVHAGSIDRSRLAKICFTDRSRLHTLEEIMHPLIWQQMRKWRQQHPAPYAIIEASSLRSREEDIDYIITVTAPREIRQHRVSSRGERQRAHFTCIDQLQDPPQGEFTIENGGELKELYRQVERVHHQLLQLSRPQMVAAQESINKTTNRRADP